MQGQPAFSVLAHDYLSGSTHISCHYEWSFIILHAHGCIGFMIINFNEHLCLADVKQQEKKLVDSTQYIDFYII